jgi:hypothetical protein
MFRATVGVLLAAVTAPPLGAQVWSARRVHEFRDVDGVVYGSITHLAARPGGGFYLLDGKEARVVQFSAEGRVVRSFGRFGAGPGELSRFSTQLLLVGARLAVVDPGNERLNLFGLDGTFESSQPLTLGQALATGWATSGDQLVCLSPPMPGGFGFDETGPSHTLWAIPLEGAGPERSLLRIRIKPGHDITPGASVVTVDLSAPKPVLASGAGGVVLLAVSDTYRIRVIDPTGREIGNLGRDVTPRRYTSIEKQRLRAEADSSLRRALAAGAAAAGGPPPSPRVEFLLPEAAPVVESLVGGDQFVLVGRGMQAPGGGATWDLLGYDGRFLGSVSLPRRFVALAAAGNRVWGVERTADDEDVGVVFELRPAGPDRLERGDANPGRRFTVPWPAAPTRT